MFADFRGATQGTGKSFKGALNYFLNDKGEDNDRPTSDERVDVLELRNLATDNPRNAWFEMMNTAKASEALKEAAGIRKGGRAGEKPVFTYHLAWHDTERPDRAEMLAAARSTIRLLGLQNHQALIVAHTDTGHPHVHVIVNRVNPENGRYAGLSNSWKQLKGWAIDYSKEKGTNWHVPLEQAKDARESRKQTERQSAFNKSAQGRPIPEKREAGSGGKSQTRPEWEARKGPSDDNRAAEAKAAGEIRAKFDAKWQGLRRLEEGWAERRTEEAARFREDRQISRNAIYAKYEESYKAIWRKEEPLGPFFRARPISDATLGLLSEQRRQFEQNERSLLGRLVNASALLKGKSVLAVVKLALNSTERRRLFDTVQRNTAKAERGKPDQAKQAKLSKKAMADALKAMRTRELAEFDRETKRGRDEMANTRGEQVASVRAMKSALSAEGKAAWAAHAATYRAVPVKEATKTAPERTAEKPKEAAQDRFGRSRDRKPRQPRQPRQEATGRRATVDHDQDSPERPAAAFSQASQPEDDAARTRRKAAETKARWEAERKAREKDKDLGR